MTSPGSKSNDPGPVHRRSCSHVKERSRRGGIVQEWADGEKQYGVQSQSTCKYIEYHSVCSLVEIGIPPSPLPQASMPPPPQPRGGDTLASKSTNGWFVGPIVSVLETFIQPWLLWSAQYKRFFFTVQYFNLRVPIAQQPGQAVVLGRLSLKVCLRWLFIFICK